jgi:hypothetical protein
VFGDQEQQLCAPGRHVGGSPCTAVTPTCTEQGFDSQRRESLSHPLRADPP